MEAPLEHPAGGPRSREINRLHALRGLQRRCRPRSSGEDTRQADLDAAGVLLETTLPGNGASSKRRADFWCMDGATWTHVHVHSRLEIFVSRFGMARPDLG